MGKLKLDKIGSLGLVAEYLPEFIHRADRPVINVLKQICKDLDQDKLERISLAAVCYHLDSKGYTLSAYEKNEFRATGNVSLRTENDDILIKPSGERFWFLDAKDFILLDSYGTVLEGKKKPSIETPLHTETYHKRPDINAIVHTHPRFSIIYSLAGRALVPKEPRSHDLQERVKIAPIVEKLPAGSYELAEKASNILKKTDAVILQDHGLVTVGKTLSDASELTEMIEHEARIIARSNAMKGLCNLKKELGKLQNKTKLTEYDLNRLERGLLDLLKSFD